jgi:hypothetical protein
MRPLKRAFSLGLTAIALLASTALFTIPAEAAESTALPLAKFDSALADGWHRHAFVTGGPGSDSVVVTDFSGTVVKVIENLPGAAGLALSDDSRTLYVGLSGADAIAAIDTWSLTERARYSTGEKSCPTNLAVSGRAIWFGYGCRWNGEPGNLEPGLGSLTFRHGKPQVQLAQQGTQRWFSTAPLVKTSSRTGLLALGEKSRTPAQVQLYDISTSPAQFLRSADDLGGNFMHSSRTPDIFVYRAGDPALVRSYQVGDPDQDQQVAEWGLAWDHTGRWLVAITATYWGENPTPRVSTPLAE